MADKNHSFGMKIVASVWSDNRWLMVLFALFLLGLIWFATIERIIIEENNELEEAARETTNIAIALTQQANQLVDNEASLSLFRKLELGYDKAITVLDADGIARLRYFKGEEISGVDMSQGPLYKNAQLKEAGTFRDFSSIDHIERIYSYRVLPEHGLIIGVGSSVQEVLNGFEFRKKMYLISSSVVSVIIVFFCGLLIQRSRKEIYLSNVLKENNQRLIFLHEATGHLLHHEEGVDHLLQTILRDALQLLGAPDGHISLLNESRETFEILYGIGLHTSRIGEKIPKNRGMHGEVCERNDFVYVNDYGAYPRRLENIYCSRITSAVLVPLKIKDQIIGGFAVTWQDEPRVLSEKVFEIIHQYAILAAIAIEEVQAREDLQKTEERYRLTLEAAQEAILDWDLKNGEVSISRGWPQKQALHVLPFTSSIDYFQALIHPDDREMHDQKLNDHLSGRVDRYECEFRIRKPDGAYIWVSGCGKVIFDKDGKPIRMVAGYGDITARKQAEILLQKKSAQIRTLAYTDILTGLPNGLAMQERLSQEIDRAQQNGLQGTLLNIDLENFQAVNDAFGHSYGNEIIRKVGDILQRKLQICSFLSRTNEGQFAVLLPGINQRPDIEKSIISIMSAINREYDIAGIRTHISSYAGIVIFPKDGNTAEEIMKNADIALHDAKKAANYVPWSFFETKMKKRAYEVMLIKNDLRHAINNNELELYYQPKVYIANGKVDGFEALLRWRRPEHGLVSPLEFIPLAEETGLIHSIGEWVLWEACKLIKKVSEAGHENIRVSVNISPYQLSKKDFIPKVMSIINKTGIKAEQLEIEITESGLLESLETGIRMLNALKSSGIRVSLDDFGTGYSSLNYLMRLPVQILKLDKTFVDEIPGDLTQSAIARSVIEMAHTLHIMVVAEGIETQEQFSYLKKCGCDFIQGYFISKPVPESKVGMFLEGEGTSSIERAL